MSGDVDWREVDRLRSYDVGAHVVDRNGDAWFKKIGIAV